MPTNWAALRLTWEAQSISVHWRLSLAGVIVTHLVTRSSHLLGLAGSPSVLIRRDLQPYRLPAYSPVDLPKCCSPLRGRQRRWVPLCGHSAARSPGLLDRWAIVNA